MEEMTNEELKNAYNRIAPHLDAEGFRLYAVARKLTGFSEYQAFPYEDARGLFETANGHQLMKYLIADHFDAVDWDIVPGTCYEAASLLPADTSTPEYQAFERAVYEETLRSLGFRQMESERNRKEQNIFKKKRGNDAR